MTGHTPWGASAERKRELEQQAKIDALAALLARAQRKLCEARCLRHDVLSTSHIVECSEARDALRAIGRIP